MDGFLDWYCYCYNFNSNELIDVKKCYENLEYRKHSAMFNTVILFKRNNELYKENIGAMIKVYDDLFIKCTIIDIDINQYIKSNTLSYDDFVKNYSNNNIFVQFLIDNLEYKPCDIKIALKD